MKTRLTKDMRERMHKTFMSGLVMPSQPALDVAITELTPAVLAWFDQVLPGSDLAVLGRFGHVNTVGALRIHTSMGKFAACPGRDNSRDIDHAGVRLNEKLVIPIRWERGARVNEKFHNALDLCAIEPEHQATAVISFGHLIDAVINAQRVVGMEMGRADVKADAALDAARYVEDLIPFWPEAAKWLREAPETPDLSALQSLRA